jgi:hypothetical protein
LNTHTAKHAAPSEPVAKTAAAKISTQPPGEFVPSSNGHRFAANDPNQTPSHTRLLKINNAANATPDGGHTAVTTPSCIAISKPNRAVTK